MFPCGHAAGAHYAGECTAAVNFYAQLLYQRSIVVGGTAARLYINELEHGVQLLRATPTSDARLS